MSGYQGLRRRWVWEGSGCDHKWVTGGTLVVMHQFCILIVSILTSRL